MRLNINGIPQLIARIALGIGFLLPVADRIGLLGAHGSGNVTWGDWDHFTAYAYTLMPILPRKISDFSALIATTLEVIFGICLILGFKISANAIGASILTLTFALSMMITQGIAAPFNYPVFIFVGAGLLLSCADHPKWSIDSLRNQHR